MELFILGFIIGVLSGVGFIALKLGITYNKLQKLGKEINSIQVEL